MEQYKFKHRCSIHIEEKVQFFKVNNNTHKLTCQPFFSCLQCMTQNDSNLSDHFIMKDIIKGNKKILQKWPPINNQEIMKKLIEIVNQQSASNSNNNIFEKIISYYKNLTVLILEQIDLSQKKMIQIAETLSHNNIAEEIIKEYQQISKLDTLRNHLLNNNITIEEKERICTQLIEQSQSQNTIQQLESLLNSYQQKLIFNPEPAQNIIESILNNIKNIQLFQEINTIPVQSLQVNNNIQDLKLMHSNYQNGNDSLEISTHNNTYIQVRVKNERYSVQVVSNFIFQANKKYIIRFKIDNLDKDNGVWVGLTQDKNIHTEHGLYDYMCCFLTNNGQQIVKNNKYIYGIDNQLKGQGLVLSDSREIELRISINDQILHLLDYPNYQYKVGLEDQNIPNLINGKDLRLFIGLKQLNTTVTLTHTSTVNSFEWYINLKGIFIYKRNLTRHVKYTVKRVCGIHKNLELKYLLFLYQIF